MDALVPAESENLTGKVLLDVANPLDFSAGMPPTLTVCNDDSLAEQIQRAFPETRVVKSLNTVNADVMVEPGIVPGLAHDLRAPATTPARRKPSRSSSDFGWPAEDVMDLGGIRRRARPGDVPAPLARLYGASGRAT